jgi:DNA-binding Lrp family transcriptional regulator
MKAKIRTPKPEARSSMLDGVRSRGRGKSRKHFSGYTPDELAGFRIRNVEIAENAIRGGRSYSQVAREYHLSPERVRQIVERIDPEAYLKKREARRNRKNLEHDGWCATCGKAKRKWQLKPRSWYCHVDPEGLCCKACRQAMHQRMIILECRCGRKSKIKWGKLLYRKSRGGYKKARMSADGETGTYVCLSCYRANRRQPKRLGKARVHKDKGLKT